MFLLIIDAHSKWLDIHITNSSNAQTTIEKRRITFASKGLPEIVVFNNGPTFVRGEFKDFRKKTVFDILRQRLIILRQMV